MKVVQHTCKLLLLIWNMSQDLDAIYSMVNQYMASTEHVRH